MDWPKKNLAIEVERLRAILHEHSQRLGQDPRPAATTGAAMTSPDPDPYGRGNVLIDARAAVLLESDEVSLIDTKSADGPVVMMLALSGRINYSPDRVEHAYLTGADGAAAIVADLIGLAQRASSMNDDEGALRFAAEFKVAIEEHLGEQP